MNTFSHCPKCKQPMLNEDQIRPSSKFTFQSQIKDVYFQKYWKLSCSKNLDHNVLAYTVPENDAILERLYIDIVMATTNEKGKYASWNFTNKRLSILDSMLLVPSSVRRNTELELPFFIPDLSNYDKLLNKLKTCLTFG